VNPNRSTTLVIPAQAGIQRQLSSTEVSIRKRRIKQARVDSCLRGDDGKFGRRHGQPLVQERAV
jgi:hypothetical protein